eukprot:scaffold524_cov390-Prasinococcus_capsulatus_cf.AAC.5
MAAALACPWQRAPAESPMQSYACCAPNALRGGKKMADIIKRDAFCRDVPSRCESTLYKCIVPHLCRCLHILVKTPVLVRSLQLSTNERE